uniref:phosphotransferase n=1 Tax=Sciscionella sediminilitoris TaxID=1445613 RepID=UPI0006902A27
MTPDCNPITELRLVAEAELQTEVTITTPTLEHATGTLARFHTSDAEIIAKVHRTPTLHKREVHAYRTWTTHLEDAAPRLIAVAPNVPGIVITGVPGQPLDSCSLEASEERQAHRSAGIVLRKLHHLPVRAEATDIAQYLASRGEYWLGNLTSYLSRRDTDLVRVHLHQLSKISDARIAPCHLDFQPRNLIWHTNHGLRIIDFENSREDLAARDLARLATRIWPHRPDLRTAFLDGYGPLDAADTDVLTHVTALEAVTSLGLPLK